LASTAAYACWSPPGRGLIFGQAPIGNVHPADGVRRAVLRLQQSVRQLRIAPRPSSTHTAFAWQSLDMTRIFSLALRAGLAFRTRSAKTVSASALFSGTTSAENRDQMRNSSWAFWIAMFASAITHAPEHALRNSSYATIASFAVLLRCRCVSNRNEACPTH
jgi:hypothetical protein